jgi:hypothetical protein
MPLPATRVWCAESAAISSTHSSISQIKGGGGRSILVVRLILLTRWSISSNLKLLVKNGHSSSGTGTCIKMRSSLMDGK